MSINHSRTGWALAALIALLVLGTAWTLSGRDSMTAAISNPPATTGYGIDEIRVR